MNNELIEAVFLERHNRFVASVGLEGRVERVYVPNTGRLAELALPGEKCLLAKSQGKYRYRLLYFYYRERPVFIDSVACNSIFAGLLATGAVPGMEELRILRREPACGHHRFDFLLEDRQGKKLFAELKSCTLAEGDMASFPDAVSERAARHVEALAATGCGILIFFLLHGQARRFIPNYHTDYEFYLAMKKHAPALDVRVFAARYGEDLSIESAIPASFSIPDVRPCGSYMTVLRKKESESSTRFPASAGLESGDYYILYGTDDSDVFIRKYKVNRIARSQGLDFLTHIPVVTGRGGAEMLERGLTGLGGQPVDRIMETRAGEKLLRFRENPLKRRDFWDMVMSLRFAAMDQTGFGKA
jgi:sugar fermentation stimulation protein A